MNEVNEASATSDVERFVIFPFSGFTNALEMLKEIRKLQDAVRQLAAANAWQNFGECRAFTATRILKPHELDALARDVLGI